MACFGDVPYAYSGALKTPLPWTGKLLELKEMVQSSSGRFFNSCLLNYYADGGEGMGWHSDDEKSLVSNAAIASLSLGAPRNFRFKHRRTGETVSVLLENGSLLLMEGETQTHWVHCLPKSKRILEPRINLTFRLMKDL
jgi:alkylated DNA repair dioxygenase AlkB